MWTQKKQDYTPVTASNEVQDACISHGPVTA